MASMNVLAETDYAVLFFSTLMMLLMIAVLIGAIAVLRRKLRAPDDDGASSASGFNLAALRQLVRDGKMTPDEFEQAKAQIVQATQRAAEREKPINAPAPEPKTDKDQPH